MYVRVVPNPSSVRLAIVDRDEDSSVNNTADTAVADCRMTRNTGFGGGD
jgi:hypothetical protein